MADQTPTNNIHDEASSDAHVETHRRWPDDTPTHITRRIAFLKGVEWALQQPGVQLLKQTPAFHALYAACVRSANELGYPDDQDWTGINPGDTIGLRVRLHMIKNLHDAIALADKEQT